MNSVRWRALTGNGLGTQPEGARRHTGKVIDQQAANFAGGDDGWPNGVASLIRRQVLVSER